MFRIPPALLLLAALLSGTGEARGDFGPWDPDVSVGDAAGGGVHAHEHGGERPVYNGVQAGAYFLIRFFQIAVSPQDGPNCPYRPTCSAYGRSAVSMHGAFLGAVLAGDRILRCNPYNRPGNDPVPEKVFSEK